VSKSRGGLIGELTPQPKRTIGPVHRAVPRDLSVTPQARRALDRSIYEAQRRGHDSVDAEHILYSLIGQTNCAAAKALMTVGANPARILQQVFQIWGIPNPGDPPNSSSGGAPLKRRPPRW
jgi:ATP-dependent Clp protease ATP-binding subunit ClpA